MKRFFYITAGTVLMSLGLHLFLIPADLAVGGLSGVGMQLQHFFPGINLGVILTVANILFFILAFFFVGWDFAGYTIYSSFLLSGLLGLLEHFRGIYNLFPQDMMTNLLCGVILLATGLAFLFNNGASGGGLDIPAKIITKYSGMSISLSVLLVNSLVAVSAVFVYGIQFGIYAIIGVVLNSWLIDKMIAGLSTKLNMLIITSKKEVVVAYIHEFLDRGATFIKTQGTYTDISRDMISVVLPREDYVKLRRFLEKEDPHAFVTANYVYEVMGEGFTLAKKNRPK